MREWVLSDSGRLLVAAAGSLLPTMWLPVAAGEAALPERQLTCAPHGHMLTNAAVWSADARWIVYDTRESLDGSVFDGTRIERVDVGTGRVEVLYESARGACCGVVTASPVDDRVVFIHGPEAPTADWSYSAWHRRGVVVRADRPGRAETLDARDLLPPFTPGALRGGSHVHMFSPDGRLVSFTYEDAVLAAAARFAQTKPPEQNLRGVGVTICDEPVTVPKTHPRNHDGSGFSVLVTRLHDRPTPGSDQIRWACEEAWVGTDGYCHADGTRQRHALAFQGDVITASGQVISEVFLVDLPEGLDELRHPGDGRLAGTATTRPVPPQGVSQRRLTDTTGRRFPGIAGPRHWLRSSPDGSQIAFLARDEAGVVQIFTVSPTARPADDGNATLRQITRSPFPIASAFSWSPCGRWIAYVADGSVFRAEIESGRCERLTARQPEATAPRPEACVHSPDGCWIAFLRPVPQAEAAAASRRVFNQIFVVATAAEAD